ncbi:MAG TPA: flippase [bacterium]|nr:flippase [bacterium]
MSAIGRIIRNTSWQIVGQAVHLVLSLALLAVIPRYLGAEEYGKYSLIFVIIALFATLTDFGTNDIVVRELSKDRSRIAQAVIELLILKTVLGLAVIAISIAAVAILGYAEDLRRCFALASISLLFLSLSSTGNIVFRVNLSMQRGVFATAVKDILALLLSLLVIFFDGRLIHFILVVVVANFVNLIVVLALVREFLHAPSWSLDLDFWKRILRSSLPLGCAYSVVSLYMTVDMLILEHIRGAEEVGYYNASYKFVYLSVVFPLALATSLFPFMSEYSKINQEKLKTLFQKSFDYTLLVALPLATSLTVLAPKIIVLVFGSEFTPSIPALQILVWGVALMFPGIVFGYLMIALDQQKKSLVIDCWGLGVNVGLNLVLIPMIGFIGAAIVTVVTEFCVLAPTVYLIQRNLKYRLCWNKGMRSLLAAAVCGLTLAVAARCPLLIQGIIGGLVLLVAVWLLRLVSNEDIELVLQRPRPRSAQG